LSEALSTGKRGANAGNAADLEAQAKMKTIVNALEKRFPGKTAHDEAAV
jgi:UDP-N-acetylmuramoyl-tripeptide--D-alanyl-D-alanine ligase